MHNLSKLVPITTNYSRGPQSCDLRYNRTEKGNSKFSVSELTMQKLGLHTKGFQLHINPDDQELYLSTHPHDSEDCVMFRKRSDSSAKSSTFSSQKFESYLTAYGLIPETGEVELDLNMESAGEVDGVSYYLLVPVGEASTEEAEEDRHNQDDSIVTDQAQEESQVAEETVATEEVESDNWP